MIADMDEENRDDHKGKENNMNERKLLIASEVAEILGGRWDRKKVHEYLKRGKFPEPIMKVGVSPVWTEEQIRGYMKERGIR